MYFGVLYIRSQNIREGAALFYHIVNTLALFSNKIKSRPWLNRHCSRTLDACAGSGSIPICASMRLECLFPAVVYNIS